MDGYDYPLLTIPNRCQLVTCRTHFTNTRLVPGGTRTGDLLTAGQMHVILR